MCVCVCVCCVSVCVCVCACLFVCTDLFIHVTFIVIPIFGSPGPPGPRGPRGDHVSSFIRCFSHFSHCAISVLSHIDVSVTKFTFSILYGFFVIYVKFTFAGHN